MARKGKGARVVGAVLLVNLFLFGLLSMVGSAADPEPEWQVFPETNFDPGPGWPAGWTPSAAPTSISPERQAQYESFNGERAPEERFDRLVLRVQDPLPKWTREYPYYWEFSYTGCGKTTYLYYYPYPDGRLVEELTGEDYAITEGGGGECGYYQVKSITKPLKPSPEELEYSRLVNQMHQDIETARKGLEYCPDWSDNQVTAILVCFNGGNGSAVFDAPAYLDTSVNRVRVPVRFVSELMGARVTWDEARQQVLIEFAEMTREVVKLVSKPGYTPDDWWDVGARMLREDTNDMKSVAVTQPANTILLTIGETTAYVNGASVTIDAPPVILAPANRTMVPLRFVSEHLGADVYWVGDQPIFKHADKSYGTYQVHIYTKFHPWYEAPTWYLRSPKGQS